MTTSAFVHRQATLLLMFLSLMACDSSTNTSAPTRTRHIALSSGLNAWNMVEAKHEDAILLDMHPDGSFVWGTVLPVPKNTDAPRLIEVHLHTKDRAPLDFSNITGPVEQLSFWPERPSTLLAVTRDQRLIEITLSHTEPPRIKTLDTQVFAPVSTSPSGTFLAYAKGESPLFQIVRLNHKTNTPEVMTREGHGFWSPAVDDAGNIVSMGSPSGHGELYSIQNTTTYKQRTERQKGQIIPVPSGPTAPLLIRNTLWFEHQNALYALSLRDGAQAKLVHTSKRHRLPVWLPSLRKAIVRADRGWVFHDLQAQGEVRR